MSGEESGSGTLQLEGFTWREYIRRGTKSPKNAVIAGVLGALIVAYYVDRALKVLFPVAIALGMLGVLAYGVWAGASLILEHYTTVALWGAALSGIVAVLAILGYIFDKRGIVEEFENDF